MISSVTTPRHLLLHGLLAGALLTGTAARAALWVSQDGNDAGPGTEEQPLATLARARDMVRTLNGAMTDDITVFVNGTQRLAAPLEFGPEDSATNGYSIIYTAAPGARPVLTGAFRVGGWSCTDRARNRWEAPEPTGADAGTLYVGGVRADPTQARIALAQTGAQQAPAQAWRNPADIVYAYSDPEALWGARGVSRPLLAVNLFERLGTPGEAYVDRPGRRIYYTPRPGEDLAQADSVLAAAPRLLAIKGAPGRPVRGLVFKAIRFEFARPPQGGAAVQVEGAADLQFLEDTFAHVAGPALRLGDAVAGCVVEGCVFGDVASSAIAVTGSTRVRIAQCRFSHVAGADHAGAAVRASRSQDLLIEHSQVDHFATTAFQMREESPGEFRLVRNAVAQPAIGPDESPAETPSESGDLDPAGVSQPFAAALAESFETVGPPHPPTSVCAEPEDGFAYVTWVPPCEVGGSPVTSYVVSCSTGGSVTVSATDFLARGYIFYRDLQDGRSATFTVSAVNALGASPPSLESEPVVPAYRRIRLQKPPTSAFITLEGAQTRIRFTPSPTGTGPVTAYMVTVHPAGTRIALEGRDILDAQGTAQIQRLVRGLTIAPGSTVTLSAVNAKGEGEAAVARVLR